MSSIPRNWIMFLSSLTLCLRHWCLFVYPLSPELSTNVKWKLKYKIDKMKTSKCARWCRRWWHQCSIDWFIRCRIKSSHEENSVTVNIMPCILHRVFTIRRHRHMPLLNLNLNNFTYKFVYVFPITAPSSFARCHQQYRFYLAEKRDTKNNGKIACNL